MLIPQNNFILLRRVTSLKFDGISQDTGWHFGAILHDHTRQVPQVVGSDVIHEWKEGDILLIGPDVRGGKHLVEVGDGYITCHENEIRGKYIEQF